MLGNRENIPRQVVHDNDDDDNEGIFGRFLLEKLSFPKRRSTRTIARVMLAMWMIILLTTSYFHVPGIVYVLSILSPLLMCWYPKLSDLERW